MFNKINEYSEKIYNKIEDNILARWVLIFIMLWIYIVPLTKERIDDAVLEEKYRQSVNKILEYKKSKPKNNNFTLSKEEREKILEMVINNEEMKKIREKAISEAIKPDIPIYWRNWSENRKKRRESMERKIKENEDYINNK